MKHLKQMGEYILRNKELSLASIIVTTITFFIAIFFILSIVLIQRVTVYFERQPHLIVIYEPQTNTDTILTFRDTLERNPYVLSVDYVSAEKALAEFNSKFEEENIDENLDATQFPPNLRIKLRSIADADKVYSLINQEKEANGKVTSILYLRDIIDRLRFISNNVKIGGGVTIVLLTSISVVLILITIGFNISKYATEIEIMQLIGATPRTIVFPFTLQGGFYGFAGGAIASSVIVFSWLLFLLQIRNTDTYIGLKSFLSEIPLTEVYAPTVTVVLIMWLAPMIVGLVLGLLAGYIATKRHIK